MATPSTEYDNVIRELAAGAVEAAKKAGYCVGTYGFGNYIAGQWKVILGERPHLAHEKIAFLALAGEKVGE